MKKALLFLFIVFSLSAFGQTYQYMGAPGTTVVNKGSFRIDSFFYLPNALPVSTILRSGALRYNTVDSSLYVWSGTQWRAMAAGSGSGNYIQNQYAGKQTANAWFDTLKVTKVRTDTLRSVGADLYRKATTTIYDQINQTTVGAWSSTGLLVTGNISLSNSLGVITVTSTGNTASHIRFLNTTDPTNGGYIQYSGTTMTIFQNGSSAMTVGTSTVAISGVRNLTVGGAAQVGDGLTIGANVNMAQSSINFRNNTSTTGYIQYSGTDMTLWTANTTRATINATGLSVVGSGAFSSLAGTGDRITGVSTTGVLQAVTVSNGITATSSTLKLGGAVTEATTISSASFAIKLQGANANHYLSLAPSLGTQMYYDDGTYKHSLYGTSGQLELSAATTASTGHESRFLLTHSTGFTLSTLTKGGSPNTGFELTASSASGNLKMGYKSSSTITGLQIDTSGRTLLDNVPVYADNAAATAASLPVNTLYKTATGQLMIVY